MFCPFLCKRNAVNYFYRCFLRSLYTVIIRYRTNCDCVRARTLWYGRIPIFIPMNCNRFSPGGFNSDGRCLGQTGVAGSLDKNLHRVCTLQLDAVPILKGEIQPEAWFTNNNMGYLCYGVRCASTVHREVDIVPAIVLPTISVDMDRVLISTGLSVAKVPRP